MNVLLIHAHDLGRELGCYGSSARTPALDALAARSTLFRRAYCASPTCSPSRAAMLTGQWAHRTGMLGLAHRGFSLTNPERHLAAWLKRSGWHTALCGIQHEFSQQPLPYDSVYQTPGCPRRRDIATADAAIALLRSAPREPFFLSCGFFWPHREFGGAGQGALPAGVPAWLPDDRDCLCDYADYLAAISAMDAQAGRVIDALHSTGLEGRTLIVFTTDHGPPFPGAKCQLTEAGLGVALLVSHPAGSASESPALVSQVDIFPTLCDLLDVPKPPWLDGVSLRPLLEEPQSSVREAAFAEVNFHACYEPQRCTITTGGITARRFPGPPLPIWPNVDDSPTKSWTARHSAAGRLVVPDCGADEPVPDLERWMKDTGDPILAGPIPPPPDAKLNNPSGYSPSEPCLSTGGPPV